MSAQTKHGRRRRTDGIRSSHIARRVSAVEGLLIVLATLHFFVQQNLIAHPMATFLVLGGFTAIVLLFQFTPLLADRMELRLRLDCLLMIAFITLVLILSDDVRGSFQNLYLVPIVTSALMVGGLATVASILLVGACRVVLDQLGGYGALTVDYGVTLLGELAPAVLVAYLVLALAGEFSSAQRRIRSLAARDNLTGLFNMKAFTRLLQIVHTHAERNEEAYSVLMVDLDALKSLNDRFGHEQGDRALQAVADALRRSTRTDDLIARYGGDEFTVCLVGANQATAKTVAHRVRHNVYRTTMDFAEEIRRLTVSIGMSTFPEDGGTVREILKHADRAMYEDKQLHQLQTDEDAPDSRSQATGEES
jgi:diguanylate cyclase (GGDEF)-like protein